MQRLLLALTCFAFAGSLSADQPADCDQARAAANPTAWVGWKDSANESAGVNAAEYAAAAARFAALKGGMTKAHQTQVAYALSYAATALQSQSTACGTGNLRFAEGDTAWWWSDLHYQADPPEYDESEAYAVTAYAKYSLAATWYAASINYGTQCVSGLLAANAIMDGY